MELLLRISSPFSQTSDRVAIPPNRSTISSPGSAGSASKRQRNQCSEVGQAIRLPRAAAESPAPPRSEEATVPGTVAGINCTLLRVAGVAGDVEEAISQPELSGILSVVRSPSVGQTA